MEFTRSIDLPAPGPEIFALMTTHEYQQRKAEALGATDVRCNITDHGQGAARVVVRRTTPSGVVPELIRAMVKSSLTVVETEDWAQPEPGGHPGRFTVEVSGAPVRVAGSVMLEPAEGGCRLTFSGDLRTSIPLFKAAIEQAAAGRILDTIDTEFALLRDLVSAAAGH